MNKSFEGSGKGVNSSSAASHRRPIEAEYTRSETSKFKRSFWRCPRADVMLRYEERRTSPFATHWVDDCFDQFEFEPTIKHEIKRYRTDLKKVLGFFGPELATVVEGLYANSLHHAATDQGIHRLLYGGLLAHAESREEQQEYLMEHAEIFLGDLDTRLAQRIRERLSPLMIGLTNKTAQEFWFACEEPYEPSVAALYTLVATPAIYLHDWREEAQEHEANISHDEPPSDQDLLVMIDLFEWGVHRYIDERKHLRFEQLRLFVEAFAPVLSSENPRSLRSGAFILPALRIRGLC